MEIEMQELSQIARISLYLLLALIGLFALLIFAWQIQVLRGKAMDNPDGSVDDWHEQKIFYGVAVADIFLACPLCFVGIVLVFITPRWGFYLLSWVSFWYVWANIMTTATSLKFEKPKITPNWILVFPLGILVGLVYFIWTLIHFDIIYKF
jgi:hypothetical protein